jgi:hypothetical protein
MPPYEPRNASMPTIGDLRALKGMDDATFFKLASYLTTSNETAINLNTASPEVLSALTPNLVEQSGSGQRNRRGTRVSSVYVGERCHELTRGRRALRGPQPIFQLGRAQYFLYDHRTGTIRGRAAADLRARAA